MGRGPVVAVAALLGLVSLAPPATTATEGGSAPRNPSPSAPVAAALDWLARHQDAGGGWRADGFPNRCKGAKCEWTGGPLNHPGVTGLALLAFVGAGYGAKSPTHGTVVEGALKYLVGIQDKEGCFGPRTTSHFTYNHAIACLAVAEACRTGAAPDLKEPAKKGAEFILQCQNPGLAWRYGVRPGDNDTSITGWMAAALRSARDGGIEVPPAAFEGALAWLDRVTEPESGRAGYTSRGNGPTRAQELMDLFPREKTACLTADAVHARILCGQPKAHPLVAKGMGLIRGLPPDRNKGNVDLYYWYFGTEAMRGAGTDTEREAWKKALEKALVPNQRKGSSSCARGSWDLNDPWRADGGRVYTTALAALALEAAVRPRPPK